MNQKVKLVMTSIVMSAMLAACSLGGAPGGQSGAKQAEAAVPVVVQSVVHGTVQGEGGLTGKLMANQTVEVVPKSGGKIKTLSVKMGQKVNKGDVLFTIDQEDLQNSVRQAEASYQQALAGLQQNQDNSSQGIVQAQNNLLQGEQSLADAKRNLERTTQLYKDGVVSEQQLEQAKTQVVNAEVSYRNMQKTYENAQKQGSINVSQASVNQAKVSLQNAQSQLKNATVVAPISGVIASVNGAVGEMASQQSAVVTIVNTNPMNVKVQFSEQEVSTLHEGDAVNVMISVLNKTVQGKVNAISPVMDNATKSYPVEIVIPNEGNQLRVDMVAKVNLLKDSSKANQSLVVPRTAVIEEDGTYYAYKLEGDSVKKVEITTGSMSSDQVEVVKGLAEKDQVVVKGQTLVQDGSKVKVE